MTARNLQVAFLVALAISAMPLACAEDESAPSNDDASSGGAAGAGAMGAGAAGGSGGFGPGGDGGGSTGGSTGGSGKSTGGVGGRGGTNGVAGTSGASGTAGTGGTNGGEGGAPEGGAAGEAAGGEGGDGWERESLAVCKRICEKTESLNCAEAATCVEDFRWTYFAYPWCREVSERMLDCLDREATTEDFACRYGRALPVANGPCQEEFRAADDAYCCI